MHGALEAVWYAVPMVGIPMFSDQVAIKREFSFVSLNSRVIFSPNRVTSGRELRREALGKALGCMLHRRKFMML